MNHIAPTARAEAEQRLASDPAVSAFVSAHAGTGKTKLLIDRLLRLMLSGAKPERILCLTFTKAAAAEMAIRLQRRLGGFVTLPDAALDDELKALLVTPTADARGRARKLFADVLDLPGGMRISTIHAFCQSLLRRFPLEAAISPHFRLIEEADARAALEAAREVALPRVDAGPLAVLAGLVSADGFAGLVAALEREHRRLGAALAMSPDALAAAMRRAAWVATADEGAVLDAAVGWAGEARLRGVLLLAADQGSAGVVEKTLRMLDWLGLPRESRVEFWGKWEEELFRASDGAPAAASKFCNARLARVHPEIGVICAEEQARVQAVQAGLRGHRTAAASAALLTVAAPILQAFARSKSLGGLLDYHDLIDRTGDLLRDGQAAWVLFKLDGGLDHLLLDEVQDTAPAQWDITGDLTADFFVGEGARESREDGAALGRTVFAVGDRKQSIYSFQGADPAGFDRWRDKYRARVQGADRVWRTTTLDVSFRSTAPVLRLVDAVFANPVAAAGVCGPGAEEPLHHVVRRVGQAGAVELWPLAPRPATLASAPWTIPERNQAQHSAPESLVVALADWIAGQIGADGKRAGVLLESAGRPLSAGDILILVRRRGEFDRGLVRALKARDVPVAGLDRMMLTEQLAVRDLVSLCEALLLPEDDLSFAEFLTSPLGELGDPSLMDLVAVRSGTVWEALRARAGERPEWQRAHDFFVALLARVDFAAPYALLSEALGPLGGRARLFARLGPEAAEPVDELLAASLRYSATHPPSLQGFLHWLGQSGAEVKREPQAAGDVVRIMTVHGAKGLEAPLVILPDTVALPPDEARLHFTTDPQTGAEVFLWAPNKDFRGDAVDALRAREAIRRGEEYNRLLYVALTRARDRVLVCGWQPRGEAPAESWYALIAAGMRRLGAAAEPHVWGATQVLRCEQDAKPDGVARRLAEVAAPLPAWAGAAPHWRPDPLPPEPALPRPLAPSRPEGIAFGQVPAARSPLQATGDRFSRGRFLHTLMQHLPAVPKAGREAAALAYAARAGCQRRSGEAVAADAEALARQAVALLARPELAPLFGPGSRGEQPMTGVVGTLVITGQVDRLAVLPDRVLIADYKTNRAPPDDAGSTPVLYLRQMAAYRALVALLYPDRPVECLLIWTESLRVMVLPGELLDRHAPGVPLDPRSGPDHFNGQAPDWSLST